MTRVALTGAVTAPWHLGGGSVPAPGTRVHLMLQGHTRSLVGRGVVRSAPFRAGPADRPGTLGTHVLIEWDRLRPITDPIPCQRLAHQVLAVAWAGTYSDVLEVPDRSVTNSTGCGTPPSPAHCTSRSGWWACPGAGREPWPVTSAGCSPPTSDQPPGSVGGPGAWPTV